MVEKGAVVALARDGNLDRPRVRGPDGEAGAAVREGDRSALQGHRGWYASNTAPSGGRSTRSEAG